MAKPPIHPSSPTLSPKVEKQVRDWHSIETKSRLGTRIAKHQKDLLERRIANKAVPAFMNTLLMSLGVVQRAAQVIAPVAHAEFKAKSALQTALAQVQAQFEEQRATLTAATHHLDTLARGSEEVAALVNGLRQGTLLAGDNTPPPRTGKVKVRFEEQVQVHVFHKTPSK